MNTFRSPKWHGVRGGECPEYARRARRKKVQVIQQPKKCSKCGSKNSEFFSKDFLGAGIRCLNCGHEKITTIYRPEIGTAHAYTMHEKKEEEF